MKPDKEDDKRLARENYGLILMLQEVYGISAAALRETAESKVLSLHPDGELLTDREVRMQKAGARAALEQLAVWMEQGAHGLNIDGDMVRLNFSQRFALTKFIRAAPVPTTPHQPISTKDKPE